MDAVGSASSLPVIDVSADSAPAEIRHALTEAGFFYVVGHDVDEALQHRIASKSRQFFDQELESKLEIRMAKGGHRWRGYFPIGAELTSGRPDRKEGLYFGAELGESHPKVRAGTPLHGKNLFPEHPSSLRETVLQYLDAMTALGHRLMEGIAESLSLAPDYFSRRYTAEPLVLFRIFNYPAIAPTATDEWSVGEHTDYGLLTILLQDDSGGLEVKSPTGWIAAPPVKGSFVCNIGDMLDRMTGGLYRSTPHRVRHVNVGGRDRLSFPFFFDPSWDAEVKPIDTTAVAVDDQDERWDRTSVHDFHGTYGDYLLGKVSKVFPELRRDVL